MVSFDIEQLWYTWSFAGLERMPGYQIRAASAGLQDLYTERLRHIDRYLRYQLPSRPPLTIDPKLAPDGSGWTHQYRHSQPPLTIDPKLAPISLSLINTGAERILVNRQYVGKDPVGRGENSFIHLLAGLPLTFSARDAISLWNTPFWVSSDSSIPRSEIQLPPVSLSTLNTFSSQTMGRRKQYLEMISRDMPFIIEAYLTRQHNQHIYIAAPPEKVAALILGLTLCLPNSLLEPLTFSTYEHDIAQYRDILLVGTCWIPEPTSDQDLPEYCYREHLSLNCYKGIHSHLPMNKLAADFARYATEELLADTLSGSLSSVLDLAERDGDLNVDLFLQHYSTDLQLTKSLTLKEVEAAPSKNIFLIKALLSKNKLSARELERMADSLLTAAQQERNWWEIEGKSLLRREQSQRDSDLENIFSALGRETAKRMLTRLKQGNEQDCLVALDVLTNVAPPFPNSRVWTDLLGVFSQDASLRQLLQSNQHVYGELLTRSSEVLNNEDQLIIPLLPISFAAFTIWFRLQLPKQWKNQALLSLLEANEVHPDELFALDRSQPTLLEDIFSDLLQYSSQWARAFNLFQRLVQIHYPRKMQLLFLQIDLMLRTYPGEDAFNILLTESQLSPRESQAFLENYGRIIASTYPTLPVLRTLFASAVSCSPYPGKIRLLNVWLSSSTLDRASLEDILHTAHLDEDEIESLLENGLHYITQYPESPLLLQYIQHYLQNRSIGRPGAEKFMQFLCETTSLPEDIQLLAQLWQIIGNFVARPIADRKSMADVSTSLTILQKEYNKVFSREECILLLQKIMGAICITSEDERDWMSIVLPAKAMLPPASDPAELLSLLVILSQIVMEKSKEDSDNKDKEPYDGEYLKVYVQFLLSCMQEYELSSGDQRAFICRLLKNALPFLDTVRIEKLDLALKRSCSASIYNDWVSYKYQISFNSSQEKMRQRGISIAEFFNRVLSWLRK